MDTIQHVKLIKRLEIARSHLVVKNGKNIPESIFILHDMLDGERDPHARYDIYQHIVLECNLTKYYPMKLAYTKNQYMEFSDLNSLICYSEALIENGEYENGIECFKNALGIAIREKCLINDAAVSYVRNSISTNSVRYVEEAVVQLISSLDKPRECDSSLELDWIGAAEKIGVSHDLLAELNGKVRALSGL